MSLPRAIPLLCGVSRVVPVLYLLNNNYGWVWKYVDSLRNTHNVVWSHLLFHPWGRFPFIHTDSADPFVLFIDKEHVGTRQTNKTDIYCREVTSLPSAFSFPIMIYTRWTNQLLPRTTAGGGNDVARYQPSCSYGRGSPRKVSVQKLNRIIHLSASSPSTFWHQLICRLHLANCGCNRL